MSSILSTSSCGEGTHTTSLPDWPTSGAYSALGAWAEAQTASADRIRIDEHRLAERHTDMFLLQLVWVKWNRPAAGPFACGTYIGAGGMMAPPRPTRQPLRLVNLCSCRGGTAEARPCPQSRWASRSAKF